MSRESLEANFRKLTTTDPRAAAEVAYVLAVLYRNDKHFAKARMFAQESIDLFSASHIRTLEDAAARFVTLEGVALPSLIHEGVVRERLRGLLSENAN